MELLNFIKDSRKCIYFFTTKKEIFLKQYSEISSNQYDSLYNAIKEIPFFSIAFDYFQDEFNCQFRYSFLFREKAEKFNLKVSDYNKCLDKPIIDSFPVYYTCYNLTGLLFDKAIIYTEEKNGEIILMTVKDVLVYKQDTSCSKNNTTDI